MTTRRQLIGQLQRPGQRPEDVRLYVDSVDPTWHTVVKSVAETKNSDTTLADDAELLFPCEAEGIYVFEHRVFFDTSATPDFKFKVTGPSTPDEVVLRGHYVAVGDTADTDFVDTAFGTEHNVTGTGGTTGGYVEIVGLVNVGAAGGVIDFQWAQNTSDAADTTVLAGSHLRYLKVGGKQVN